MALHAAMQNRIGAMSMLLHVAFAAPAQVDTLLERVLTQRASSPCSSRYAELESATLGKPCHLATVSAGDRLSGGLPALRRHRSPRDIDAKAPRLQPPSEKRSGGSLKLRPSISQPPLPTPRPHDWELARRQALLGGLGMVALLAPRLPAEASFGSGRAAVTSLPALSKDLLENFDTLDPKRQAQASSLLQPKDLDKLLKKISSQKSTLRTEINAYDAKLKQSARRLSSLRVKQVELREQVRKNKADLSDQQFVVKKIVEEERKLKNQEEPLVEARDREAAEKLEQKLQEQLLLSMREQAAVEDELPTLERNIGELTEREVALQKAFESLERKDVLEERLVKRAALLRALDAQPPWFNYVAAFAASIVSTLVMHPVDTLKTREVAQASVAPSLPTQVLSESNSSASTAATAAKALSSNSSYEVSTAGAGEVGAASSEGWSLQGYLSLYKGIQGALLKEGPPSALYLGVYEAAKASLLARPTFAAQPLLVYLLSGAAGETFGSVIRAPAEAIKSRVQAGLDPNTGESIRKVLLEAEGRERVARAWSASLWRDVPFGAVQLAIFEGLKSYVVNSPDSIIDIDVNSLLAEVLFGATGGAIGALLTVPMDVVTTRILTESGAETLGFVGMTKELLATGGWKSLITGWQSRTGYWAPAISIFLSCYCLIRQTAMDQNVFG